MKNLYIVTQLHRSVCVILYLITSNKCWLQFIFAYIFVYFSIQYIVFIYLLFLSYCIRRRDRVWYFYILYSQITQAQAMEMFQAFKNQILIWNKIQLLFNELIDTMVANPDRKKMLLLPLYYNPIGLELLFMLPVRTL